MFHLIPITPFPLLNTLHSPTNRTKTTIAVNLECFHLQSTHWLAHTAFRLFLTFPLHSYRIQSHLQQFRMTLLQLLSMGFFRDQVSHILLLCHFHRRCHCRNRLRNEQHRVTFQTRNSTNQRERLILFITFFHSFHTIGKSKPTIESAVNPNIVATSSPYSLNSF